MTGSQARILRTLSACVDARAYGHAIRAALRIPLGVFVRDLDELQSAHLVVEDRRLPGVIVLTATGSRTIGQAS